MFKKRKILFLFCITLLISSIVFVYSKLNPRAITFTKSISKLDISSAKPTYFKERWSEFNGNGYALAELQFDNFGIKSIVDQCISAHYKSLPVTDQPVFEDILDSLVEKNTTGYYNIFKSNNQISINIINTKTRSMITYTTIF